MNKLVAITLLVFAIHHSHGQGLTETHSTDKYSIRYPDKWKFEGEDMGAVFHILAAKSGPNDGFNENVSLVIQDLTGINIDLDRYVELAEKQILSSVKNGKIVKSQRLSSGSLQLHKLTYTGEINEFQLKLIRHYHLRDEKAYILTFTAETKEFEKFKFYGQQILNSFRFK